MPEVKTEGKHLWNGCGSEAGKSERKRTAKPSTGTWKEGMRNQAGEKGETEEARAESGTGEATVRRKREERKGRSRRLSSWKRKRSGRKKADQKWKMLEARAETGTGKSHCEARPGRDGKEEQRLSSQNPKLRRTKECRNSGGQKAERKR